MQNIKEDQVYGAIIDQYSNCDRLITQVLEWIEKESHMGLNLTRNTRLNTEELHKELHYDEQVLLVEHCNQ